ncbi:DUF6892 domain-containing protein [Aneurinibacillus aneurinilyticus]|uniref:DUF6892 domain-containing protein n=1 Tax=Aneurinibacillus aneurinilyticus TaxID=1391 RepID=UPI0035261544
MERLLNDLQTINYSELFSALCRAKVAVHALEEEKAIQLVDAVMQRIQDLSLEDNKYGQIVESAHTVLLEFSKVDQKCASWLYEKVLSIIQQTDWNKETDSKQTYLLVAAFCNKKGDVGQYLPQALLHYHNRLNQLIETLITYGNKPLVVLPADSARPNGTLGELVVNLLHCYFYHSSFSQTEASPPIHLILKIMREYPESCNNITVHLLAAHTEGEREIAELIQFFITSKHKRDGVYYNLALDFLGTSDFAAFRNQAQAIFTHLMPYIPAWTNEQFEEFVQTFIFYAIAEDERVGAFMKSLVRRKVLETLVAQKRSTEYAGKLNALLKEVNQQLIAKASSKNRQQIISKDSLIFRDFNFKLLVIEELMYNKNILKPRFDLYEFARDYTDREIIIEEEGYDILPEAKKYFEELVVTKEHVQHVEDLIADGGLDVYMNLYRFWDGEDDTFDVKELEHLDFMPNLKTIDIWNLDIDDKTRKQLEARGIKVTTG